MRGPRPRAMLEAVRRWAVAIAAALATAACGGGSGGGSGRVRLPVFRDPSGPRAYRQLIDAFARQEAGARVQLIEASDRADLLARLSTSFSGGTPPDLFLVNYRFYGQFAAKGVLEPLGE